MIQFEESKPLESRKFLLSLFICQPPSRRKSLRRLFIWQFQRSSILSLKTKMQINWKKCLGIFHEFLLLSTRNNQAMDEELWTTQSQINFWMLSFHRVSFKFVFFVERFVWEKLIFFSFELELGKANASFFMLLNFSSRFFNRHDKLIKFHFAELRFSMVNGTSKERTSEWAKERERKR